MSFQSEFALIRRCLAVLDGSDFEADEFPSMLDAQQASTALAAIEAWVREASA